MIHTRLCEVLGVEHPIVSAPMAGTATAELAAAVSEAGGLGLIGTPPDREPEWLREQIRLVRDRTDRPFGVGFISSFPGLDGFVQVALSERVPVVSHSFADPSPYVKEARERGIVVMAQVQKIAHARTVIAAGVDVVGAQGIAAGGHTGHVGTVALVPAVVDIAGVIPVVAAGGIADGRGLAAALMLGADGVWMGTRFVLSAEAQQPEWAKAQAVAASADDTVLTRIYDLAFEAAFPADIGDRVLRNEFTNRWEGREDALLIDRESVSAELRDAYARGDEAVVPNRVGSAVGLIDGVEPAADIVRRIIADAESILRRRPDEVIRG